MKKKPKQMSSNARGKILIGVISAFVALALVGGLLSMEPPWEARDRNMDSRRVAHLNAITAAIELYWERHEALPSDLRSLNEQPGIAIETADPKTGKRYPYSVTGTKEFDLCVEFAKETKREPNASPRYRSRFQIHGAGKFCYQLELVDEDKSVKSRVSTRHR